MPILVRMCCLVQATRTRAIALVLVPLLVGSAPSWATAQSFSRSAARVAVGGDLMYAQTLGDFHQNVKEGYGAGGHLLLPSSDGILALRIDAAYLQYGQKSRQVVASTPFQQFLLDETTSNNIITAGIGPQFMVPRGPVRPYLNAMGGFSRFYTESTLDGLNPTVYQTSTTESSDWKLTYGAGAGLYIPLGSPTAATSLDIGAQYYVNGRTTYLTKDDIQQDPQTGGVIVTPRRSEVRFVTYRVGVTVAF